MAKKAQNGQEWPTKPRMPNMPRMAQNSPKGLEWPKRARMAQNAQNGPKCPELGPNTLYSCIYGLKMSQINAKSDTDYPEKISIKSKILNMPKKAQNCPK